MLATIQCGQVIHESDGAAFGASNMFMSNV